jgi:hypothetical protein
MDERFVSRQFPRASAYHPEWVIAGVSGALHTKAVAPRPNAGRWMIAPAGRAVAVLP